MAKRIHQTVDELVSLYLGSNEFNNLAQTTRNQYKYWLRLASENLPADIDYQKITGATANSAFDAIDKSMGTVLANRVLAVCRRLYSYAIRMDLIDTNPWRKVKSKREEARRIVWTPEQVSSFLSTAYSEWETRSIGLIAQMCYEWCQRVGDMRLLTWDAINFEEQYVKLVQSKRRAQVKIPISNNLFNMLQQQNGAFDFQDYVAPSITGNMKPYDLYQISRWVNKVKSRAGLPDELRLADLRRTGTTEMVEAGVPMPQIMAVTGHSTPASVMPYMKNSLTSASEACTLRSVHTGK